MAFSLHYILRNEILNKNKKGGECFKNWHKRVLGFV